IFDAVKTVFAKNMEEPVKGEERLNKGRSVITKVVNSLTAKSEIGSPMASMYLLGHSDHYTSHQFQRFYWRSYVKEGIVGISPVLDYMYRPRKYENVSLYDWIRFSNKTKLDKKSVSHWSELPRKSDGEPEVESESELSTRCSDSSDDSDTDASSDSNESSNSNTSSEAIDEVDTETNSQIHDDLYKQQLSESDYHRYDYFLDEHPQHNTHKVRLVPEAKGKVPDFAGGALPRHDRGNREEYCMTMLTLFHPWRRGRELKNLDQTWNQSFEAYQFTDRQKQIIKFFNLRYECNDARDDFSAQRKAQQNDRNGWPQNLDDKTLEWLDTHDNNQSYAEFSSIVNEDEDNVKFSDSMLNSLKRMADTEQLAEANGLME
ncbi:hypothetical protein BC629DRAFT_1245532, partial [Irpex lacteus]